MVGVGAVCLVHVLRKGHFDEAQGRRHDNAGIRGPSGSSSTGLQAGAWLGKLPGSMERPFKRSLAIPTKRRQRTTRAWIVAVLLLAIGLGAYVVLSPPVPRNPSTPEMAGENVARAPTLPPATVPGAVPEEPLPPLADSDVVARELSDGLSSHPALTAWLATPDLVRRFVAVVCNVAAGDNPRPHLTFMAPESQFGVIERHGRVYIDPASYARYAAAADVVASLDAEGTAGLYRTLTPLIDEAYRELGHPEGAFPDTLRKAIGVLLATPVVEGDVQLTRKVTTFALADPNLEKLSPAQKHFLRMGPRNIRLIQAKLRAIAAALGLPEGKLPPGA
jgi:hypothetical protein